MATPTSGSSTDDTQIEINWSALTTDAQKGGSTITSYILEWDAGTNGVTYTAI